jgi:hypothetical protein
MFRALVVATLVLLAIAVAGVVGVRRLFQYNAMFEYPWAPREYVSDVYDDLRTGDLMLFVASVSSGVNSMYTQTFYSHVGMLVRDRGVVYLSEATRSTAVMPLAGGGVAPTQRGADLTPLLVRLKHYIGTYYLLRLRGPGARRGCDGEREQQLASEARALRRAAHPYPTFGEALAESLFGWRAARQPRHCFQHVAHLLAAANLGPADGADLMAAGIGGVCRAVSDIPARPLAGGHAYDAPVLLTYDVR